MGHPLKPTFCPQHFPSRRVTIPIAVLAFTSLLLSRIIRVEPGYTPAGDFRIRFLWAFSTAPSASLEFTQSCSSGGLDDFSRVEDSPLATGLRKAFRKRPRKQLPEEVAELECSHWWQAYADYHRRVLDYNGAGGWPAPRLAVVKKGRGVLGDGGGLGDTVSSQVSSLVFAMLSGRVFQVYWTKAQFVFENPYINTSYTGPEEYLDLTPDKEQGGTAESRDGKAQSSCVQVPSRNDAARFWLDDEVKRTGDFNAGPLRHRIELLDTNKGVLNLWWDEPLVRDRMLAAGLDRENLYGCALNFLFRPIPAVAAVMLPIAKMLLDPGVFSIGIHVRTDYTDSAMKGGDGAKSVADYWTPFQCAKDIELQYAELIGKRKIIWYVASDSDSLRQNAQEMFGRDRQIYLLDAKPTNAYIQRATDTCSYEWDCLNPLPVKALETTFVEWWLYSLNDFFVITDSGLSVSSVGRSMKRNTTYYVDLRQEPKPEKGQPICMGEPTLWRNIENLRAGM